MIFWRNIIKVHFSSRKKGFGWNIVFFRKSIPSRSDRCSKKYYGLKELTCRANKLNYLGYILLLDKIIYHKYFILDTGKISRIRYFEMCQSLTMIDTQINSYICTKTTAIKGAHPVFDIGCSNDSDIDVITGSLIWHMVWQQQNNEKIMIPFLLLFLNKFAENSRKNASGFQFQEDMVATPTWCYSATHIQYTEKHWFFTA